MLDDEFRSNVVDAAGVPASVLSWSKLDDVNRFPSDSTLRLAAVDLSHIGNYSCTPRNEVGAGQSASIYLDVIGELFSWRYAYSLVYRLNTIKVKVKFTILH